MSQAAAGERVLTYAAYLALPDDLHAEYVDGRAVVNPPPSFIHQKICGRLVQALSSSVSRPAEVVAAAGWQMGTEHVRIPDVMVLAAAPSGPLVDQAPLVCVEVLSSNRSDDLVRKSTEYLEAGVAQYWVVDPHNRVIDVYNNSDHGWQTALHLTADEPHGRVTLPRGVGRLELELGSVLD